MQNLFRFSFEDQGCFTNRVSYLIIPFSYKQNLSCKKKLLRQGVNEKKQFIPSQRQNLPLCLISAGNDWFWTHDFEDWEMNYLSNEKLKTTINISSDILRIVPK